MAQRATVRSRTGFGNLGDLIWAPETTTPPTHLTCNSLPYAAADEVRIASSTTMNSALGAVQMVRYVSRKGSYNAGQSGRVNVRETTGFRVY